jgi:LPS-assembly lipoprotein
MRRTFVSFLGVFILASCGFSPMYGTAGGHSTSVESRLGQVEIGIIPDRSGQYLRNQLIDRFYRDGMPASPAYMLDVDPINEAVFDFDITIESEATRRQLKLTTEMKLIDKATEEVVLRRDLQATTSHNVLESEFSTLVTEQSARDAALNDLARQIERQLVLYFSR